LYKSTRVFCFRDEGEDLWIQVSNRSHTKPEEHGIPGLQEDWRQLLASGSLIDLSVITELAKRHHVVRGKWMIFSDTSFKTELNWNKIVKAIVKKRIPTSEASVSQNDGTGHHCICVFNKDYTDTQAVNEREQALRSTGIHTQMVYKPDVFTYTGIYSRNEWGIHPTIYKSEYIIPSQCSIISVRENTRPRPRHEQVHL